MRTPANGAGARDQAGGRDRGEHTARTRKPQDGDEFAARRDAWLGQVAGDGKLPGSAVRVAVVIALHLNRDEGYAWPSSKTIRAKTALSNGAVHNAINALIKGEHLRRDTGGGRQRGTKDKGNSSRFWPLVRVEKLSTGMESKHEIPSTPLEGNGADTLHSGERILSTPVERNLLGEPLKKKETPVSLEKEFAAFWNAHPKPKGEDDTRRAFKAIVKKGANPADVIAAAMAYGMEVADREERFIKASGPWLRGGYWKDQPTGGGTPQRQSGRMSAAEFAQRRAEEIEHGGWQ